MRTWTKIGTARYDGKCCLCDGRIRARKDWCVYSAPHVAHEACFGYAVEYRDGVAEELPEYLSARQRAEIEAGRPLWAARLAELA